MSDYILLIFAIILMILGIIGCLVPVLPGPPLSYLGLILLHITRFADFSSTILIILAAIAVVVTILDYIVPVWGTKKFGGSKYGTRGATVGLIIGLFLGPLGIIIGPFIGAVVGELIFKDDMKYATQSRLRKSARFPDRDRFKACSFVYNDILLRKGVDKISPKQIDLCSPPPLKLRWTKGALCPLLFNPPPTPPQASPSGRLLR